MSSTTTVIRFWVSVPVLSEQMVVTEPSVSTAYRRRMSALPASMRWAPSARVIVTTAGRLSGMAATARLTAVSSSVSSVLAPQHPEPEDDQHDRAGDQRQALDERVEPLLQRRPTRLGASQQVGDPAELGRHAGGGDHQRAAAGGRRWCRNRPSTPARPAAPTLRPARTCLSTGTDSPVSADSSMRRAKRLGQPAVGRHPRAGLEQHDVAGHQLAGGDLLRHRRRAGP